MSLSVVPSSPDASAERLGDTIGSYVLEKVLGEGTMGRVYQGRHVRLERAVALKVLHPQHIRDRQLVQRFLLEARAVNQINHHHIVEVHDFVEELLPERVFCVMELLSGETLTSRLATGTMPLLDAVGITRQIAEALSAAHAVGVVHRDLKPDNLFLTSREGQKNFVKVLDFGVAKLMQSVARADGLGTLSGQVVGTPRYMAPEQAAGLEVDHRADIYSLGTILYELLAGRTPFVAGTFGQLSAEIITKAPPPLPETNLLGEVVPRPLTKLVMACLAKSPDERPASMADVLRCLQQVPLEDAMALPKPRRNGAMIGAFVGVAALAAGAVVLLAPQREPAAAPVVAPQPPAPPPVAVAPPPPKPVEVPAPPANVTLSLSTTPAGATIRRTDTKAVLGKTPLSVELPRAPGDVALQFELSGYGVVEKKVRLDSNGTLDVTLVPKPRTSQAVHDGVLDPFGE